MRRFTSALAVVAVSALGVSGIQAMASPASATAAVSVVGTLTANGQPVPGAEVGLWAWPDGAALEGLADGADVPIMRVATDTTDSSGQYALAPDLTLLDSSYVESDGAVDLDLQVASGGTAQSTSVPAAIPGSEAATESAVAVAGAPASVDFDKYSGKVSTSLDTGEVSAEDGAGAPIDAQPYPYAAANTSSATLRALTVSDTTAPVLDPYEGRDPASCGSWKPGTRYPSKPEHFVNVYAWSGAYGSLKETVSNSQSLGVAVRYNSGPWGGHGSLNRTTNVGNGATRKFGTPTSVSNLVNYRKFTISCVTANGLSTTDKVEATGYYGLEVPSLDKSVPMPSWTNCLAYGADAKLTKAVGKNTKYTAGVDLGFIKVSAEDTFSKNMSIEWVPSSMSWFCGSNSQGPASAPQALVKQWTSGGGGCGVISASSARRITGTVAPRC